MRPASWAMLIRRSWISWRLISAILMSIEIVGVFVVCWREGRWSGGVEIFRIWIRVLSTRAAFTGGQGSSTQFPFE
jgi:hypothetical protein